MTRRDGGKHKRVLQKKGKGKNFGDWTKKEAEQSNERQKKRGHWATNSCANDVEHHSVKLFRKNSRKQLKRMGKSDTEPEKEIDEDATFRNRRRGSER